MSQVTTPIADRRRKLLQIGAVAELLSVSKEHVRRLNDRGAMPKSINLGRSIRWDSQAVESWLDDGCPDLSRRSRA